MAASLACAWTIGWSLSGLPVGLLLYPLALSELLRHFQRQGYSPRSETLGDQRDWKLRPETLRPYIEPAMKETRIRELDVVMSVVRKRLSKETGNLSAQILIRNRCPFRTIERTAHLLASRTS